jgi:hypothetical protein
VYKPCLRPAQRQTDLRLCYALFATSESFRHLNIPPLTTTILQVNPGPIIPPSSLTHHHEAIPYLRSLALGPIPDLPPSHTHTRTPQQNTSMKPIKKAL